LPNTRLYEMVRAQANGKTNWTDSGDLDVMFQGAYTTRFYRAVADALHLEVRTGQASAEEAWSAVAELEPVSRNRVTELPILSHAGAA
jgi:anaerobic magnesium-protoporphyrin IX monomethyl ester cyclase